MSQTPEENPPKSRRGRFLIVVAVIAGVLLFQMAIGVRMIWRMWHSTPPANFTAPR